MSTEAPVTVAPVIEPIEKTPQPTLSVTEASAEPFVGTAPKPVKENTSTDIPVDKAFTESEVPTIAELATKSPVSTLQVTETSPESTKPVAAEPIAKPIAEPTTEPTTEPKVETSTESAKVKEINPVEVSTPGSPLANLFSKLNSITDKVGHREIWGVILADYDHVPSCIVLEKFLRANNQDVSLAAAQLTNALQWHKEVNPAALLEAVSFDEEKFGGLGFVTVYEGICKEIVTWNIYGAVKDKKATFGDVDAFVNWRSALMEIAVKQLDLNSATERIPEGGVDEYRMIQVHDYQNVSFLRMDPTIRAATKKTIETLSLAYPELLKEKYFVNVPRIMGWVFTALKVFLSPATIKKFHPLSYGTDLAGELFTIAAQLPVAYGGMGEQLETGLTVKYAYAGNKDEDVSKA